MRYYCHHCHNQISAEELLPEFTCPSCRSGFVEEMPNAAGGGGGGGGGGGTATLARRMIQVPNLDSTADESQMAGSDDGLSGLVAARMSSDEFSDDNSDVEFLDAVNGPLAQVFGLFQSAPATTTSAQIPPQQSTTTPVTTTGADSGAGQSSTSESPSTNQPPQPNRIVTRSTARLNLNPGQAHPPYSVANQTLADVLNDFITGVSFGTQFPEGTSTSNSQNQGASSSGNPPLPANRGLINIDFPLPFFLHSNPGDYAWGNAGFDAVITQLLNNLDGSNSGPPPMPKEQVENLPTVKISDEQVKNTNLQCTVCMDDFQVGDCARQLPCEHFFHQDCIVPWLNLVSIFVMSNYYFLMLIVYLTIKCSCSNSNLIISTPPALFVAKHLSLEQMQT